VAIKGGEERNGFSLRCWKEEEEELLFSSLTFGCCCCRDGVSQARRKSREEENGFTLHLLLQSANVRGGDLVVA
jgi:hypothetical protein